MSKSVVLCSGGMDSVTALQLVANETEEIHVLFVDYGQKVVAQEEKASRIAAERCGAFFIKFDLSLERLTRSSLIHDDESMTTEVQGRNAILLSLGAAYAQTIGAKEVILGIQKEDVNYGDAQPAFFDAMNTAMQTAYGIEIKAPLLYKNKGEIILLAQKLHVDLNQTYSCYFDAEKPCGECPSCKVRLYAEKMVKEKKLAEYESPKKN